MSKATILMAIFNRQHTQLLKQKHNMLSCCHWNPRVDFQELSQKFPILWMVANSCTTSCTSWQLMVWKTVNIVDSEWLVQHVFFPPSLGDRKMSNWRAHHDSSVSEVFFMVFFCTIILFFIRNCFFSMVIQWFFRVFLYHLRNYQFHGFIVFQMG